MSARQCLSCGYKLLASDDNCPDHSAAELFDVDRAFDVLLVDPVRNEAEAELDRQSRAEIEAGGGFRGSIDDLLAAVDGASW